MRITTALFGDVGAGMAIWSEYWHQPRGGGGSVRRPRTSAADMLRQCVTNRLRPRRFAQLRVKVINAAAATDAVTFFAMIFTQLPLFHCGSCILPP